MASTTIHSEPDRAWIPTHSHDTVYSPKGPATATTLPAGFPKSIVSPTAWTGTDFDNDQNQERYILVLNEGDVKELEQACRNFEGLNLPFERVSQESFPLPTLGSKLKALAKGLVNGVGFLLIRGLDPKQFSNEANLVMYLGVSAYIGEKRGCQDELGNMLLHLTDLSAEAGPDNERQAPYSNVAQPFHTDAADILGLQCLGEAEIGGECQLASTATIYNEIVKTRPDIIHLLSASSWVFDRFGQSPPYMVRPILYPTGEDRVILSFSRRPLVGNATSPRTPGIPDLSAAQVEALNAVQFAAEEHALAKKLKTGDMLFWNNMAMLHARKGWTDSPNSRRHLVRLWLRNDDTEKRWPIPEELQAGTAWNEAFDHAGRSQLWPVAPIRERAYIANQQRSSGHA
ncbi:Clavaminate synthase-like protein [Hyaloscypha bicolor E]|uniref:Clavaminate synthase-like protein n=1 Tax=Hyaloscypha bicolor E TaxID=1095630 RepID=A0A2J6T308_9HELO|nr:Clavaminate synthase-like protein [Hyaloscypha bicolor E]PMD57402.1 Clavaminate synthase-like protein [Hyaloscypha bicolor E]